MVALQSDSEFGEALDLSQIAFALIVADSTVVGMGGLPDPACLSVDQGSGTLYIAGELVICFSLSVTKYQSRPTDSQMGVVWAADSPYTYEDYANALRIVAGLPASRRQLYGGIEGIDALRELNGNDESADDGHNNVKATDYPLDSPVSVLSYGGVLYIGTYQVADAACFLYAVNIGTGL